MAYGTVQAFKDAYPDCESIMLSNLDDPKATVAIDTRIETALNNAQSVIDGYVGVVADLPLASPPLLLAQFERTLARCELDAYDPRDHVTAACDRVLEQLDKIVEGKMTLGVNASGEEICPDVALPTSTGCDRVFTLGSGGTLAGY